MSGDELLHLIRSTLHLWVSEEMETNPDSDVTYSQRFEEHSDQLLEEAREMCADIVGARDHA
jgi:hypothetical protein